MVTNRPTLWRVLSEASRIISSHSGHFFALSILFIFPTSVAAIIYSFLLQPPSLRSLSDAVSTPYSAENSQLLIQLLYFLSIFLFSLCSVPSITYTTFHGFYGAPVKFLSSLKSIFVSFFPLLATILVLEMIMGLIVSVFLVLILLSYNALASLGFEMDYDDQYFLVFVILLETLLAASLLYLLVEWYLMYPVVVLESKWGFGPLKRSSYLVKGARGVVFLTVLFFALSSGLLSLWFLRLAGIAGGGGDGLSGWLLLQMVVFAVFSTALSLYGLVANTVLFVYCKAMRGESVSLVGDEIGAEYVRLPSDVVSVV